MAYRKKTLRKMSPKTREIAVLINDLELSLNRLARKLPDIARLELDSQALFNARNFLAAKPAKQDMIPWDSIAHGKDAQEMLQTQEPPETPDESAPASKPASKRKSRKKTAPTEPLIPETESPESTTPESEEPPDAEIPQETQTETPAEPEQPDQQPQE